MNRLILTAFVALAAGSVFAGKSHESRIEYIKKSPSENTSSSSARQKIKDNTKASLDSLRKDINKNKK